MTVNEIPNGQYFAGDAKVFSSLFFKNEDGVTTWVGDIGGAARYKIYDVSKQREYVIVDYTVASAFISKLYCLPRITFGSIAIGDKFKHNGNVYTKASYSGFTIAVLETGYCDEFDSSTVVERYRA